MAQVLLCLDQLLLGHHRIAATQHFLCQRGLWVRLSLGSVLFVPDLRADPELLGLSLSGLVPTLQGRWV